VPVSVVLLDRIELSTSPLPRECSTTELQQQDLIGGVGTAVACHTGDGGARTAPEQEAAQPPQRTI
jgi:hypothetical protein